MDWYWLEDASYYSVHHILLPMVLMLYYKKHPWFIMTLVYAWESLESLVFFIFNDYVIFSYLTPGRGPGGSEPVNDSLLLDPFQGMLGIAWGSYLLRTYNITGMEPLSKYTFWLIFLLVFAPSSACIQWEKSGISVGYIIFIFTVLLFLYVFKRYAKPSPVHNYYVFSFHALGLATISFIPFTDVIVYRTWVALAVSILVELSMYIHHQKTKTKEKVKDATGDFVDLSSRWFVFNRNV